MRLQFGDHYVSVDIYADNAKLTAYSTIIEGNVMEGWIGLEPGQKIHLNYNILSEHDIYKLEFIVDGIVRNNVDHWRNRNKKDRKTYSAIRSIIESASVSIDGKQSQREMVVGTLDLASTSNSGNPTVGTIECRFYCSDPDKRKHNIEVPFYDEVDKWEDLGVQAFGKGVIPDRRIKFEPLTRVPKTSQVRFDMCSKSNLVRMGPEPWIIIRFFYRSQEALRQGGLTDCKFVTGKQNPQVGFPPMAPTASSSAQDQNQEQAESEEPENESPMLSAAAGEEEQTEVGGEAELEDEDEDEEELEYEPPSPKSFVDTSDSKYADQKGKAAEVVKLQTPKSLKRKLTAQLSSGEKRAREPETDHDEESDEEDDDEAEDEGKDYDDDNPRPHFERPPSRLVQTSNAGYKFELDVPRTPRTRYYGESFPPRSAPPNTFSGYAAALQEQQEQRRKNEEAMEERMGRRKKRKTE